MPTGTTITIAEAKGRPMLHWVGKRPLERVTAYPAQLVETFDPAGAGLAGGGLLFHGDNKDVLVWLLANGYRGKVDLIYIDPPFDSGADYVRQVQLRGVKRSSIEGQSHTLSEQIQYTDIWANDSYLQFIYERMILLFELLQENGSICVHCDWRRVHHLRMLLDEVFGSESFVDEIIWKSQTPSGMKALARQFSYCHETVLWYAKGSSRVFNKQYLPYEDKYIDQRFTGVDERGRYKDAELQDPSQATLERLKREGRLIVTKSGNLRVKQYLDESPGILVDTVWFDIPAVNSQALERTDYPTQKPEPLISRIIDACSNPGDLVLDCFCGSGTTPAVAQRLGRRWIAADINKGAIQTTSKRLQTIIREQIAAAAAPQQLALADTPPATSNTQPVSSFAVYRVNDYDLQIQHNEAVALVVEHLGIERKKTDAFFDGVLGQRLVKITPFNHPLTPLDLQLVKDELAIRPDEERDVVVVCLGKELATDAWLEEYNRRRPVNKIEVLELRTDQRYGNFLVHQHAAAQVEIARQGDQITVEIVTFISPTIAQRLDMDTPLLQVKIPDWRAMVDCVMVDTAYDGEVFNIVLSDVPERKNDLVIGRYELTAPAAETTVAVKIIDMLGEEVLVVKQV